MAPEGVARKVNDAGPRGRRYNRDDMFHGADALDQSGWDCRNHLQRRGRPLCREVAERSGSVPSLSRSNPTESPRRHNESRLGARLPGGTRCAGRRSRAKPSRQSRCSQRRTAPSRQCSALVGTSGSATPVNVFNSGRPKSGSASVSNRFSQLPRHKSLEKPRSSMLRALRPISAPRCGSRSIERTASARAAPSPGGTTIPQSWRSMSVAISPAGSETAIVGRPAAAIQLNLLDRRRASWCARFSCHHRLCVFGVPPASRLWWRLNPTCVGSLTAASAIGNGLVTAKRL
jgi:hypothetical protein